MNYIPTFVQDVYDKAIKIGEEKGMEKGKRELLLELMAHGYSIEEVSRGTNIPKEKVQEIISAVQ